MNARHVRDKLLARPPRLHLMHSNKKRTPDFFIVGAPKCGTTALFEALGSHYQVCLPRLKEPHFFSSDLQIEADWTVSNAKDYQELFSHTSDEQCTGEASVWYLFSQTAAENIWQATNGTAKIIVCLRNPQRQIESLYAQFLGSGNETLASVDQAILAQSDRRTGNRIPRNAHFPLGLQYLDVADFAPQIKRYVDRFATEQIHYVVQEELLKCPAEVLANVIAFLGLEQDENVKIESHNVTKGKLLAAPSLRGLVGSSKSAQSLLSMVPASVRKRAGSGLRRYLSPNDRMSPTMKRLVYEFYASKTPILEQMIGRPLSPVWAS